MIQELIPQHDDIISSVIRIQKFICVHHNGETYVTWQVDRDAAEADCEKNSREGKPWKVLAYPSWI